MGNSTLKSLLIEYDKKRINAEHKAIIRKENLFKNEPRLQEIEKELSSMAISTEKAMLNSNNDLLLKNLQEKIAVLKNEKITILKSLGKK